MSPIRAVILITITFLANPGSVSAAGKKQDAQLTVFAAASLREAFQEIANLFNKANPGNTALLSFAGSQQLVQQLGEGAPADVFASADTKQMGIAVASGRIDSGSVQTFAHNRLVVIVPKARPGVQSLHDLSKAGTKIILADKAAPVGLYSLQALDLISRDSTFESDFKGKVLRNVVSYEENVRAVLTKVVLDEADAGIVYVSDIAGEPAQKLRAIDIPDELNILAAYPIATVKDSRHHQAAEQFLQCVLSKEGQEILRRFGFLGRGD